MTEIAAVITLQQEGCQLLVNPFSTRAMEFRATQMYKIFRERHAAIDTGTPEANDSFYIADGAFDRNNDQELIDFVCTKYHLERAIILDLEQLSIASSAKN